MGLACKKNPKSWVVAVNMGYGHQRAAHAIRHLSCNNEVIIANDYQGIPQKDKTLWRESRKAYEFISRLRGSSVVGKYLFEAFDTLQTIPPFYPRRDLSEPILQVKQTYYLIEKKGLCRHLIEQLAESNPLPLVTTFFIPAFAAEVFDYPNDIYCVLCDADVSRAWAPKDPKNSRIKYFASNGRVVERLKLYGVNEKNIIYTGFPLPPELIGGINYRTIKHDLKHRIFNLDPNQIFYRSHKHTLDHFLGKSFPKKADHPLTITYTVGGAGAQRKLGAQLLHSLRYHIKRHRLKLNLVAGVKKEVKTYFDQAIKAEGLSKYLGKDVEIIFDSDRSAYFDKFTKLLHKTDLLWTKPSELSFYTGLGIPIIMAPSIGSQEDFNRVWLNYINGGIAQNETEYADEWLMDWVNSGGLARLAWSGFIYAPTHGAYRISDTILGTKQEIHDLPLVV